MAVPILQPFFQVNFLKPQKMNKKILYNDYREIQMPVYGNDGKIMLYLNQWPEIENLFPSGRFFLDKTMCGCGATTLFLSDPYPTILCSPRRELMYCKGESGDFPGIHLFKTREQDLADVDVRTLQQKTYDYCINATPFCPFETYTPKIVVSYDSFKHVAQVLGDRINMFRVVVDEAQALFTDAAYRGIQVIEFLENVKDLPNVLYMSATPFDAYMNDVGAFQGLPYVKLIWQKSSTHKPDLKRVAYKTSIKGTAAFIIRKFRDNGYFDEPIIVDGHEERSTEAVFFLNDVGKIISIINDCNLVPSEVNILCSDQDKNRQRLPKGFTIGSAPKRGEQHKTFTFCTRAAFEGVDFNSTCAYTYIFSDIKQNHLALDISYDLPQIMGRQRNSNNHFRYSGTFFYDVNQDFEDETRDEFMEKIEQKMQKTNSLLHVYEKTKQEEPENAPALAEIYRSGSQVKNGKTETFIAVTDVKSNGGELRVVRNDLAYYNERRAWDIQKEQYLENCRVMSSIDDATQDISDPVLDQFYRDFYGAFDTLMQKYCEFLSANPQYKKTLDQSTLIPFKYKYYYNAFWPDNLDRLKAVSYKEASIKREMELICPDIEMEHEIVDAFKPGTFYTLPVVKSMLQEIYDEYGYGRTAKGKDLEQWLVKKCKKTKKLNDDNGKREEGYQIL